MFAKVDCPAPFDSFSELIELPLDRTSLRLGRTNFAPYHESKVSMKHAKLKVLTTDGMQ